jgi:hypothetical protein
VPAISPSSAAAVVALCFAVFAALLAAPEGRAQTPNSTSSPTTIPPPPSAFPVTRKLQRPRRERVRKAHCSGMRSDAIGA